MMALAVDAILVMVIVETVALVVFFQWSGRGIPPSKLLGTLAAGFLLMLALRLALGGGSDGLVALCLLGSLFAHLADLASRWRD